MTTPINPGTLLRIMLKAEHSPNSEAYIDSFVAQGDADNAIKACDEYVILSTPLDEKNPTPSQIENLRVAYQKGIGVARAFGREPVARTYEQKLESLPKSV